MEAQGLAVHEALELHELLAFKNTCLTKAKTMQGLVSDNDLQLVMKSCAEKDTLHIEQLKDMLEKHDVYGMNNMQTRR